MTGPGEDAAAWGATTEAKDSPPARYAEFLERKALVDPPTGLERVPELSPVLFPFQRDITSWALRRGRAAIFAGCGMGKTLMQLEWAVGAELKRSYWEQACANLALAKPTQEALPL